MKQRIILLLCALGLGITACGSTNRGCQCDTSGCLCDASGCQCCRCGQQSDEQIQIEDAEKVLGLISESTSEVQVDENVMGESKEIQTEVMLQTEQESMTEEEVTTYEEPVVESVDVSQLTEGEKEARRQLIQQLKEQRELLYELPNSVDKTNKIVQIDAMIVQNNIYDMSNQFVSFIGDSITEGVCGNISEDGSRISYVNYVQEYLNIGEILNRGMAGRMYSEYGGIEFSLGKNLDQIIYPLADTTIIFLGANDYLTNQVDKRYGEQEPDSYSDAGYCGAVRSTMKYMKRYFEGKNVFFVLVYNVDKEVSATYSDAVLTPGLEEMLAMQKSYAEYYGFPVIDLYSTGFMDLSDAATEAAYTADGLHPNDAGNQILAQHIAAELAIYFSENY